MDQPVPCPKTIFQVLDNDELMLQPNSDRELSNDANNGEKSEQDNEIEVTAGSTAENKGKMSPEINDSGINMQTDNSPSEPETGQVTSGSLQFMHSCSTDTVISQNNARLSVVCNEPEHEQSSSDGTTTVRQRPVCDPAVRIKMLARVAVSDAHFKHQQRGDPDLTMDDKIEIAQKILDENKVNFLSRFSKYLDIEDLEYFKNSRNTYEIDFYCKQVENSQRVSYHRNKVKNRRYEAMKKLTLEGEYFSEEEMKFREPYLYDQMIGELKNGEQYKNYVHLEDCSVCTSLH